MLTGPDPLPSVTIESGTRLRPSHMSSQPLTLPPSPRFSHSFARHLVYLQPCPYSSSLHRLPPPPPSERMSFLQSFAVGLLSYARRKPFRSMAWLSFIHWVLNFARRFYNRIANDRYIRKIPSPKALLHPILGMVPSLAVSLTGTLEHTGTGPGLATSPQCSCPASTRGSARFLHTPPRPRSFSFVRPSQGCLHTLGPTATSQCLPVRRGRLSFLVDPTPTGCHEHDFLPPTIRSAPSLTPIRSAWVVGQRATRFVGRSGYSNPPRSPSSLAPLPQSLHPLLRLHFHASAPLPRLHASASSAAPYFHSRM